MYSSVVFARWRQCAPHLIMLSWAHSNPNSKQHLDQFSHFCTAHGMSFLLKDATFHGAIWTPSNTWSLEPTARTASWSVQPFCTAHGRMSLYFTMGHLFPSQNCLFPWGSAPPFNTFTLGPIHATQMVSRSLEPFLQSSPLRQTNRPHYSVTIGLKTDKVTAITSKQSNNINSSLISKGASNYKLSKHISSACCKLSSCLSLDNHRTKVLIILWQCSSVTITSGNVAF